MAMPLITIGFSFPACARGWEEDVAHLGSDSAELPGEEHAHQMPGTSRHRTRAA